MGVGRMGGIKWVGADGGVLVLGRRRLDTIGGAWS